MCLGEGVCVCLGEGVCMCLCGEVVYVGGCVSVCEGECVWVYFCVCEVVCVAECFFVCVGVRLCVPLYCFVSIFLPYYNCGHFSRVWPILGFHCQVN